MKSLLLASSNPGKLREISALLAPVHVISQASLGISPIAETGQSFIENALLKARHASKASGLPALADDSGLVVHALGGQPGLHSARYAGETADAQSNIAKLLNALADIPQNQRQACFYCIMVLVRHAEDPMPLIASGRIDGVILSTTLGNEGFGYDPVFYLPQQGATMAQLSPTEKNRISHRAQALHHLKEGLLHESL
ncbi:MAG: RdgB/HAM1 family non-canonical purine NTP pyrophosphatase [Legionellaceae bacterium]|nr:RdgB/HAM1 family non-canonical purine NTP pyrophosphatase [Legionellaceae bacterium]